MLRPPGVLWLFLGILLVLLAVIMSADFRDDVRSPGVISNLSIQYVPIIREREDGRLVTKIVSLQSLRLDRFTMVTWTSNAKVPACIKFGEVPNARLRVLGRRPDEACYATRQFIPPVMCLTPVRTSRVRTTTR